MQLFQINESDLQELEHILPQLCDVVTVRADATPKQRTQTRILQRIMRDVRWNYGPPDEVIEIPAGEDDGEPTPN